MAYVSAIPAYGRDYTSAKAVKADWANGKDFLTVGIGSSGYVNNADLPAGTRLQVRYAKQTKMVILP